MPRDPDKRQRTAWLSPAEDIWVKEHGGLAAIVRQAMADWDGVRPNSKPVAPKIPVVVPDGHSKRKSAKASPTGRTAPRGASGSGATPVPRGSGVMAACNHRWKDDPKVSGLQRCIDCPTIRTKP